eukprot:TRINITY_DN18573_c0_g1_i1.p1 TRINITY_DN18573_c0_g1~~TRINITY_DN18573_c0_g1_i1.p1  ORF type:complete len:549 (-),score=98.55 TRINITY_DN18573_c0_g1_i1:146-1792(-)
MAKEEGNESIKLKSTVSTPIILLDSSTNTVTQEPTRRERFKSFLTGDKNHLKRRSTQIDFDSNLVSFVSSADSTTSRYKRDLSDEDSKDKSLNRGWIQPSNNKKDTRRSVTISSLSGIRGLSPPNRRRSPPPQSTSTIFADSCPSSASASKCASSNTSAESSPSMMTSRERVINEILMTEKTYVDDLGIMVSQILKPLKQTKLLPNEDIQAIFFNIETILDINKQFLNSLQFSNEDMGEKFLKMKESFRLYATYCVNHSRAVKTLTAVCKDPTVFSFLETIRKTQICRHLDCESYIIKPVQRLCKYPLLLRELIKATPPDHEDLINLKKAYESIESILGYVNENRRTQENFEYLKELSSQFSGLDMQLATPTRTFIEQNQMNIFSKGQKHSRTIFIFNDLVLVAKKKKTSYLTEATFLLRDATLSTEETKDTKNSCQLAQNKTSNKVVVLFSSADQKEEWTSKVDKLIQQLLEKEENDRKQYETDFNEEEDQFITQNGDAVKSQLNRQLSEMDDEVNQSIAAVKVPPAYSSLGQGGLSVVEEREINDY